MKGSLNERNSIRLIWQLHALEFDGLLLLAHEEKEKVLVFRGGQVTYVDSNLPTEKLESQLLRKNALAPLHLDALLEKSKIKQIPFEEVLLLEKIVDPSQVLTWLKENHQEKLKEVFTWMNGTFETLPGSESPHPTLPLALSSLLFEACAQKLLHPSLDTLTSVTESTKVYTSKAWKTYSHKDTMPALFKQILKSCETGQSAVFLAGTTKKPVAEILDLLRLGVLCELMQLEEVKEELSLDELVGSALKGEATARPVTQSLGEIQNKLTEIHLRLPGLNFFQLLGVPETASATEIRDAFIKLAQEIGPHHFKHGDLYEDLTRAEEVFLKAAKAYTTLTDPDLKVQYTDRLKKSQAPKSTEAPGSMFRIQTKLLDAPSQFEKGLIYLKKKNYKMAEEFFQYALDVEPKNAEYLGHLAWSKYLQHPDWTNQEVKGMFEKSLVLQPNNASCLFYFGRFLIEKNNPQLGQEMLRKASLADPKNIEIIRELRNIQNKVK